MTRCRYCSGTGVTPVEQPKRAPSVRGTAAGPLPPFGREVESALRTESLPIDNILGFPAVHLFCSPYRDRDAWECAVSQRNLSGDGSVMVLPEGEDPAGFRWPAAPGYVVWAFGGLSPARQKGLVQTLIDSGAAVVQVLGNPGGPQRFEAA